MEDLAELLGFCPAPWEAQHCIGISLKPQTRHPEYPRGISLKPQPHILNIRTCGDLVVLIAKAAWELSGGILTTFKVRSDALHVG